MSHAAVMTALYRLFYKRTERHAFATGKLPTVAGLSPADRKMLAAINAARLARSAELHADELPAAWYANTAPATWLALKAVYDCDDAEATMRLTQSDAFELHIDNDRTLVALAGFVDAELSRPKSQLARETPWAADLLHYERALSGRLPEQSGSPPCFVVLSFGWDITAIWASLLEHNLCPTGEHPEPQHLLLYTDQRGVNEAQISAEQAPICRALCTLPMSSLQQIAVTGRGVPSLPPAVARECAGLMLEMV